MIDFPKISINNHPLMQAWNGLTRRIQTTVEHMRVTNTEASTMLKGHVVSLVAGQRQAEFANSTAHAEWCGVMCEPTVAGGTGIARTGGYAFVLFEAGLNPAPATGDAVYLSTTDGLATTTAGTNVRIGTVGDETTYVADGGCGVFMNHCCVVGVQ